MMSITMMLSMLIIHPIICSMFNSFHLYSLRKGGRVSLPVFLGHGSGSGFGSSLAVNFA
jgi:hypothetical protein